MTRVRILSVRGQITTVDTYMTYEADTGDVIMIDTAGGGGYGPPAERSLELARRDEEDAYVLSSQDRVDKDVAMMTGRDHRRERQQ